jgi:hypothetical protein
MLCPQGSSLVRVATSRLAAPEQVPELLGHADPRVTLRTYVHQGP